MGAIFMLKGNLFQYSQTLSLKQFLFRALYFAFEVCPNFDKRFNPDLLNLKTSLDKEKPCFALYTPRNDCTFFLVWGNCNCRIVFTLF